VLGLLFLGLLPGVAQAADEWPKKLYATVLVSGDGLTKPAVLSRSLNEAASLLIGSDAYWVRDQDSMSERLGGPPGELADRCANDLSCWQSVLWRGGVDVVILMQLASPDGSNVPVARVSAWSTDGQLGTSELIRLPRGGGAPLEWMAETLLVDGSLSVALAEGGVIRLNGSNWIGTDEPLSLRPGRHQLRVQFGEEVQVQVVPVLPGQTARLALAPTPKVKGVGVHRRWGLVAVPALAAAGAVVLVLQKDRPGDAAL
jgi:hypothetical protein